MARIGEVLGHAMLTSFLIVEDLPEPWPSRGASGRWTDARAWSTPARLPPGHPERIVAGPIDDSEATLWARLGPIGLD